MAEWQNGALPFYDYKMTFFLKKLCANWLHVSPLRHEGIYAYIFLAYLSICKPQKTIWK
jgi:hypothetical protein